MTVEKYRQYIKHLLSERQHRASIQKRDTQEYEIQTIFDEKQDHCMEANGAQQVLSVLGISSLSAGSIPKPFGAKNFGSSRWTTGLSLLNHFLYRNGIVKSSSNIFLRRTGRRLNRIADAASVGAIAYLTTLATNCYLGYCDYDPDSW